LLLVVLGWLLLAPPASIPILAFIGCIVAHAAASSVEFEIGPGSALPTTPVLVVALFLLPPQLVPVVAVAGLMGAATIARLRDPSRRERFLVLAGSGWHAVGPALVFAVASITVPDLRDIGIYIVALGAQFLFDGASSWVRNVYGLGVPVRRLMAALRFTFLADLLLAPIGLAAVLAVPSPGALLFLVPPTLLLAMLQLDRQRQITRAVTLRQAVSEAADGARRDVLTGLRNRLAWEEATARYAAEPTPIAIVLLDVDGLKAANDAYGHDKGDALLVTIAHVMAQVTPSTGDALAARLGGDEFGILLPADLAWQAASIANELRALLRTARPIDGVVTVSASIGVGVRSSGVGLAAAFADADRGVYEDKRRPGINRR
jgi:diguanylate cyclase (GGDEF)-like protein